MNYKLIIVIAIIIISLLYFAFTYNKLIKLNNQTKESFATMDVYLKKRWDLIPNIVETVKGYSKHEKDTFKEIAELRDENYDKLSNEEKIKTNERLTKNIKIVMALSEAYPDLKANKNFLDLQDSLKHIEDEIAQSRKYYNATIRIFNNLVEMIPSNIVAKILGYTTKNMFEANADEKENVMVNF